MTPIEIIALALIIFAVIKMFILLVKPQAWMNFAKALFKKKSVAVIIGLALGGVILYYLIQGGISIIQIFAVTAFIMMLMWIGLSGHANDLIKRYEREIKAGKLWKQHWFYTLIWIALLVWGVLVLFNFI